MAVAMFMDWSGVSADQYDAVMMRLDLDSNPAAGGILHVAAVTDDGLEVCDVWQTEQAFESFLEHRFLPVANELGLEGSPEIKLVPLHNLYAADGAMVDRIGMSSLPAIAVGWAAPY
jgi:hypothetical protein